MSIILINQIPDAIKDRIDKFFDLIPSNVLIVKEKFFFKKINNSWGPSLNSFLNFEKTNNIKRINKFHNEVNALLKNGDYYLSCAETIEQRNDRNHSKIPNGFKNIYLATDFIYKRVAPKLPIIKSIYFFITRGHNRVMSKAEILGRLISCGFSIEEYFEHNNLLYVISKKKKKPSYDMKASYYPIFKMKRIGRNGKHINIYKFRTMYPYSEYLQDFIVKDNGYASNGKIKDDYRVTSWGRIFRKYWLDETPQLINWLKGDLKLVGVRPLSQSFLNEYPELLF